MECKVVSVSSKKVIGMEYRGKNENGEIPKLWVTKLLQQI